MNTFAESKQQSDSSFVDETQHSNGRNPSSFSDDRPETAMQLQQQEAANNSPQVAQLQALQQGANNGLRAGAPMQLTASVNTQAGPMQRKSFVDPSDPSKTKQIEGKGTPWTKAKTERGASVSGKVDLYKKQMLAYIANEIEALGSAKKTGKGKYYGPHISVVISGGSWFISVNSNVSSSRQGELAGDAAKVQASLMNSWKALDKKYTGDLSKSPDPETEAVYIAFRWAAGKKKTIDVVKNLPSSKQAGTVHGEMKILKKLQDDGHTKDATGKPTTGTWNRAVRVGGTKTPCFDCGWEMGVHSEKVDTSTSDIHGTAPAAKTIGTTGKELGVTTMGKKHGKGFSGWGSPFRGGKSRSGMVHKPSGSGFNAKQDQTYGNLKGAYKKTGCSPAMN